jgi:hypothetical protein
MVVMIIDDDDDERYLVISNIMQIFSFFLPR